MNNFNPVIEIDDTVIRLGESVSISDIADVSDLDGNAIETYRFFNPTGGGFFTLDGVDQGAGAYFDVDAADFSKLRYHASATVDAEEVRALVYDGERWSNEDLSTFYSVGAPSNRPVITADVSFDVVGNEKVLMSEQFSALDPDGYPIIRYRFRESKTNSYSGHMEVDGTKIAQGQWVTVNASKLETAFYVAGSRLQSEDVWVRAFDGTKWSSVSKINANSLRNANRPIVTTSDFTIRSETSVNLIDTFELRDEDASTAKAYRFWDTRGPKLGVDNSGFIEVDGRRKQAGRWIQIAAEDMGNARFVASEGALTEKIRVRAYDGKFWSTIKTVEFESLPDPTLEVEDNVVLDEFESIPITDVIVRQSDEGPRIVDYEMIDMNDDPLSGYLELDNNRLDAGVIHNFDQDEFSRLNFVAGADHKRAWDEVKVRANNRSGVNDFFVGEWKNMNFFSEPNSFTSLIMPNASEDELNSWHDHIAGGAGGRMRLTYSFMQRIPIYYIDGSGPDFPAGADELPNPVPNANQRDSIRKAFQVFGELLDVDFVEVSDNFLDPVSNTTGGILRFGTYFEDVPVLAFAYPPADPGFAPFGGDIWINNFYTSNVLSIGPDSQSFLTILHEMGHTLGQNHPHEQEFGKTILSPEIDNDGVTVMSYVGNPNGTAARSPMLYDMRFLGEIYGYNPETRTGDDTYSWNSVRFSDLVYDAGGDADVIDASNQVLGATITLQEGQYSSIGAVQDNVVIAFGTTIENATGTLRADVITGNEVENILRGLGGDDVLTSAGGNDQMFGGSGDDRYIYNIGDAHDIIDEEKMAGRDILEIRMGETFGVEDFGGSFVSRRSGPNQLDLEIGILTDGDEVNAPSGSCTLKNQLWGGSRIESLRHFNNDGTLSGPSIDLTSVFVQSNSNWTAFAPTNINGQYGRLVAPVTS